MLADMTLFHALVLLHVVTGAVGLTAFWGPIVTKKGSLRHRKWGRAACYGFLGAGALAIAMSFLSLWGPEHRHPEIADRELFDGLFGWMMLYLAHSPSASSTMASRWCATAASARRCGSFAIRR